MTTPTGLPAPRAARARRNTENTCPRGATRHSVQCEPSRSSSCHHEQTVRADQRTIIVVPTASTASHSSTSVSACCTTSFSMLPPKNTTAGLSTPPHTLQSATLNVLYLVTMERPVAFELRRPAQATRPRPANQRTRQAAGPRRHQACTSVRHRSVCDSRRRHKHRGNMSALVLGRAPGVSAAGPRTPRATVSHAAELSHRRRCCSSSRCCRALHSMHSTS